MEAYIVPLQYWLPSDGKKLIFRWEHIEKLYQIVAAAKEAGARKIVIKMYDWIEEDERRVEVSCKGREVVNYYKACQRMQPDCIVINLED